MKALDWAHSTPSHQRRWLRQSRSVAIAVFASLSCSQPTALEPVASVAILSAPDVMLVSSTTQLKADLRDTNGRTLNARAVSWASSNSAVLMVSASGLATATTAGGPVSVTATSEGRSASVSIEVVSLEVAPVNDTLYVGSSRVFAVVGVGASGAVGQLPPGAVSWSTSNSLVATITLSGIVRGQAPGTALVSAVLAGVSASGSVMVESAPSVTQPSKTVVGTVIVPSGVNLEGVTILAGAAGVTSANAHGQFSITTSSAIETALVAMYSDAVIGLAIAPAQGGTSIGIDPQSTAVALVYLTPTFAVAPQGVTAELLQLLSTIPAVRSLGDFLGNTTTQRIGLPDTTNMQFMVLYRAAVQAAEATLFAQAATPAQSIAPSPWQASGVKLTWTSPTQARLSVQLQNIYGRDADVYADPANPSGNPVSDLSALSWNQALNDRIWLPPADYIPNVLSLSSWLRIARGEYGPSAPRSMQVDFTFASPRYRVSAYGIGENNWTADWARMQGGERSRAILPMGITGLFGVVMPIVEVVSGIKIIAAGGATVPSPLMERFKVFAGSLNFTRCLTVGGVDAVPCVFDVIFKASITDQAFLRETLLALAAYQGITLSRTALTAIMNNVNVLVRTVSSVTGVAKVGQTLYAVRNARPREDFDFAYNDLIGADAIQVFGGNNQVGSQGAVLFQSLAARAVNSEGGPVANAWVTWAPDVANGAPSPAAAVTDQQGVARTTWTLGSGAQQGMTATLAGTARTARFAATTSAPLGSATGRVIHGQTSVGIGSALVDARTAAGSAGVTQTDAQGFYTITLPAGAYDLVITRTGFVAATLYGVTVTAGSSLSIQDVPLVPTSSFLGGIAGTVRDAQTFGGLTNVSIELRSGVNNATGSALATTTSGTAGAFQFSGLAAGTYSLRAVRSGYSVGSRTGIAVGSTTVSGQDIVMSATSGSVRIVLTWGAEPGDLDSHLTGPIPGGGRFHVFYQMLGSLTASPFAALDRDDTSSFGPETVTIQEIATGVYRYSVFNYSAACDLFGGAPLSQSGARVEIYVGGSLARQYFVPNQPGTLWTVFELQGSSITPVNQVTVRSCDGGGVGIPAPPAGDGVAAQENDGWLIGRVSRSHPKERAFSPKRP